MFVQSAAITTPSASGEYWLLHPRVDVHASKAVSKLLFLSKVQKFKLTGFHYKDNYDFSHAVSKRPGGEIDSLAESKMKYTHL